VLNKHQFNPTPRPQDLREVFDEIDLDKSGALDEVEVQLG
jgi:hypothetical protein